MFDLSGDEINKAKLTEIIHHRKGAGVKNATIRRDLTAISSVLEYCEAQGWVEQNAAREYNRRPIKERRDPIVLPTEEDIDWVVSFAPGNFAKLIRLAQYTGMRQEEVASLERRQITKKVINLTKTKTNKPRAIPLNDEFMAGVVGTLSGTVPHLNSNYVFWHGEDGERYSNVASQFDRIARRAVSEAKKQKIEFRRFRFHDLRHWFAVDYMRRGGNIYKAKKILGHSSLQTTEIYLDYLTPEQAEQAKYGTAQNPAQR